MLKYLLWGLLVGTLSACSTTSPPQPETPTPPPVKTPSSRATIPTPPGVTITPYEQDEIKRQPAPSAPPRVVVPEQRPVQQPINNGSQLPAFRTLIQQTQTAYRSGNMDLAERFALQAQRLAPQAPDSFMYLAMIANQKNQYRSGESLARRGLSFAQSPEMRKRLWLVILEAAQKQNNTRTVQQAEQALRNL